jgi:hypothetical protein
MTSHESDSCQIQVCNENQTYSVADVSTNYRNLKNLLCGKDLGCVPAKNDLRIKETSVKPSIGAGEDFNVKV